MTSVTCTLPYPSGLGVNHQYGRAPNRTYLKKQAQDWKQAASVMLMLAGLRRLDSSKEWTWTVEYTLYATSDGQDLDGCGKLLLDELAATMDCDDQFLTEIHAYLVRVRTRTEQKLEVTVRWREAAKAA